RRAHSDAPARRRVTVRSSGLEVLEELEQEGAVLKFGVGDVQANFVDGAAVVGQDVDVDLSRAPTLAGGAAKLLLEVLDRVQQRARLERGLDLEHLVQEARLAWAGGPACRMASAIRATRTIALTSWTRTISAPPAMLSATAAAVPSRRSPAGRADALPM